MNNTSNLESSKLFDHYIYHANCTDGLTAVAIAVQPQQETGNLYTTAPMAYHHKIDVQALAGKSVCFLDFSASKEVMIDILEVAERVTVIDHHVSIHKELSEIKHDNFEYIYDVNKSGAGLAWDYFIGTDYPYFVQLVQDRDIWTKKFKDADALSLALRVEEFYFEDTVCLISDILAYSKQHPCGVDSETCRLIDKGKSYQKYQQYMVKQIASNAFKSTLDDGTEVMKVNCAAGLISDVGNYLAEKNKCGVALMYVDTDRLRICSLRVAENCNYDASAYAKSKGGGGHSKAAGFSIPL